jgi:SAM-dependent methyltransferase
VEANVRSGMDGFQTRDCPLCQSNQREILFNLEADQFCRINWSYNANYRALLDIKEVSYFPIDQCLQCGFVYARFLPSGEFLDVVYDRVINTDIAENASWNSQDLARRFDYIGKLLRLMRDESDRAVLDFGCGFGATTRLLADCGVKTVAYDPSPLRLDSVRKRCADAVVTGDLKDLETNAPYAGVILDNVLEHLPDPNSLIMFISGLLRPGAIVYLSVPSYEKLDIRRLQRDIERKKLSEMTLNPWEHLNYFDVEHLDRLMAKNKIISLRRCEMPGAVEIGLRPENILSHRIRNSLASGFRLLKYGISGRAVDDVQSRFYRHV